MRSGIRSVLDVIVPSSDMADRGSGGRDRSEQADPGEKKRGVSPVRQGALALSLTLLLMQACASGDVAAVVDLVAEKNANPFERDESGRTLLGVACEAGHLEVVRHLIEKEGVSPALRGAGGTTPLHIAARGGHVEVAKYLIEQGVNPLVQDESGVTPLNCAKDDATRDSLNHSGLSSTLHPLRWSVGPVTSVNQNGTTDGNQEHSVSDGEDSPTSTPESCSESGLHSACREGYVGVVKYLVEEKHFDPHSCKNESKKSPLHLASLHGHLDVVKYLVEERDCDVECKDIYGNTPLHEASAGGHFDVVQYLVTDRGCNPLSKGGDGSTALHSACANNSSNLDVVKFLVEKGNSPSSEDNLGDTPLSSAARYGKLAVVKYLVEEQQCDVNTSDNKGLTPLHEAAIGGDIEKVKYLCKKGCDPECETVDGSTPLKLACRICRPNIVQYLIDDVKVDHQCRDGKYTPLHVAARAGHLSIVKLLVEKYRCDPDIRDQTVKTPTDHAARHQHTHITSYLSSVKKTFATTPPQAHVGRDTPTFQTPPAKKRRVETRTLVDGEQNTQPMPTAPATGSTHPGGPKGTRGSTLADSPGVAILITCDYDNSEELDPLPGTKEDAKAMKTTFEKLHYVVHQQHNPTREDMKALLKEVSTSLGSLNMEREVGEEKVIIFAFSGHGCSQDQAEKIYANDGEVLDIKTEVIRPLIRHKGVQYVPKLFFIDACRGSETLISKGGGARNSDDQVAKSDEVYFKKVADHFAGNTYVAYATIPHTVSYTGLNGSMWMPRIAKALWEQNDAFRVVIGKVMMEVRLIRGEKKQQCESVDRLNIAPLYLQRRL